MKSAQRVVRRVVQFSTAVCLLAAGTFSPPRALAQDTGGDPNLSPAAGQVLNMAESGISDDVMLAYIQNDTALFNLSADDVTYLRDEGLTSAVVDAMMNRDKALAQQPPPANYNQQVYGGVTPLPAPVPANTAPPTYVSDAPDDVTYFYSDLSPYGAWVNLEGYGWCWQPTTVVVNHNWQPYCDSGHWVYTDNGWFWDSDYSWGWAPFHYGRWLHHDRVGWVWFPDRVWGPAWVTWRTEGNDCGWAPLPLHATFDTVGGFFFNGVRVTATFDFGLPASLFTFVAFNDFVGRDPAHHRLPPAEVSRIYNRTAIINNYTSANGNFINHGIPVERITAVTHTTIRPIPIRSAPPGTPRPDNRGSATLAVYRHDVQAPPRPVQVRAQQVDERHPFVQHNLPSTASGQRRNTLAPGTPVMPARSAGLPPTAPVRQPVTPSRPVNANPEPSVRPPPVVNTPPPTTIHGRTPAATSRTDNQPEPAPFVAGPDDLPKPKPPAPAPAPRSDLDYLPRSSTPAVESHSLPPLPPKPVEAEPAGQPSTVTHSYTPRMVQATQAHALPPLPAPAPSHSQPAAPAPGPARSQPSTSSPSSSGGKPSAVSGSNGSRNDRPNQ